MLFEHLADAHFWGEQYTMRTKKRFLIMGRVIKKDKKNKIFYYQLIYKGRGKNGKPNN